MAKVKAKISRTMAKKHLIPGTNKAETLWEPMIVHQKLIWFVCYFEKIFQWVNLFCTQGLFFMFFWAKPV